MFSEIALIADSANNLLKHAEESSSHQEAARVLLQLIGAIADRGMAFSNCGRCAVCGDVDDWLGLTDFELTPELESAAEQRGTRQS
jgi:hypothetical protein